MNGREEADFLRSLGQRVRGLREVRGLSQDRAAELAGMSKSMVSKIERGKRTGYNLLFLWNLTRALGVPWTELADDAVRDLVRWSRVHGPPRRPAPPCGGRSARLLLAGADLLGAGSDHGRRLWLPRFRRFPTIG